MNVKRWLFLMLLWIITASTLFAKNACTIKNGFLNLNTINLNNKEIEFTGEWEFYWNQLLSPEDFNTNNTLKPMLVKIPAVWNSYKVDGKKLPSTGYATYRIKIVCKKNTDLAIKVGSIGTAFKMFLGNNEVYNAGKVDSTKKETIPAYNPGVVYFNTKNDTTNLILQVSNFHYCKAGIWNNYNRIGKRATIEKSWNRDNVLSLLIIGCMLIFALYHLGLYALNRIFQYTLYFSLFCFVIIIRTMVVSEIILIQLFPSINWELLVKLEYLTLMLGTMAFSVFVYRFFNNTFKADILRYIIIINAIFCIIVLASPALFYTNLLGIFQLSIVASCLYIFTVVIKEVLQNNKLAIILLIGFGGLVACIVNDILYTQKIINTGYATSFGFLFFIFSQAYMLSARFSYLFIQKESLAEKLKITNQNLEKMVDRRTSKIKDQNTILVEQSNEIISKNKALEQVNDEIKAQRDNLRIQNKLVLKQKKQITSSIEYASRIQGAVIDSTTEIKAVAPKNFILFHPKDIVSGDFYWFKELELENKKYKIASVVDCTGHGVPGAFMSILGALFLSKICIEIKQKPSAAEILNKLRDEVKALLHQHATSKSVKDGMDMALIILDYHDGSIQFAGAHNPLFIIRKTETGYSDEIEEYKGDNMPIGTYIKETESFSNYSIDINPGDLLYLFSDGYYDQFGGEFGKKFNKTNFKKLLLKNAHLSLSQQHLMLDKTLMSWRGDYDQIDDITVVGIEV